MKLLLPLILVMIIAGCSMADHDAASHLDVAESLMQSDPAAAMDRLNGFDVSEFEDSATLARWALLYSEALVANKMTAPTDTIVDIAIGYYGSHNIEHEYRHASRLKALLRDTTGHDALATALYIQKEKEFFLYRERATRERYTYCALAVLFLAGCVIAWQRQRIKMVRLQTDCLMAEAKNLKEEFAERQAAVTTMESKLKSILNGRFNTIDVLCETFYESQGTKIEKKAIAEKVKSQIDGLKTDSTVFAEMEKCVDDCRDNLLKHLKAEWPEIKPEEYRLTVYLACGLSNRSIALLIGESVEVVYKRKSRLKSKLAALASFHTAQFLSVF